MQHSQNSNNSSNSREIAELISVLEDLYKRMYNMTQPECAKCRVPFSCCSPEYCEIALKRAAEFGVTLTPTGHDKLPLMGAAGCVAPPHLRPLCTLHTCDMSGLGFKRDEPTGKWNIEYHDLRERINSAEFKLWELRRASGVEESEQ